MSEKEMPGDSPAATNLIQMEDHKRGGRGGGGVPSELRTIPLSDVWNGKLFAHMWRETTRFNHETKQWVICDGGRWRNDITGERDRRMLASIEAIRTKFGLPEQLVMGKSEQDLNEHYYRCLAGKTIAAMEIRARSECHCTSDEFDTDPMLLSVKNGTIDLTTGELREHRADDMLMRQSPVEYSPEAVPEQWLKAVDLWMAGDKKMIAYLRRIVGLFLTGDIGDEAFFMLLGPPGTGKGTFVSTLERLLGPDYAFALSVGGFLKTRNPEAIPIDAHAARGMRLLTVSENEKNAQFNTAKLKQWTGGDTIAEKGMRENLSNFLPTHKLLLQTNHSPKFDKTLARRLKNIGFLCVVAEGARNPWLKKHLRENELSGILNWALGALPGEEGLHGLADWRVNRLSTPESVKFATNELLEAQDELRLFFEEACEFDVAYGMSRDEGYIGYRQWCDQTRERHPLGKNNFLATMREQKGIGVEEGWVGSRAREGGTTRVRGWTGIRIAGGATVSAPQPCEKCALPSVGDGRCGNHPRSKDKAEGEFDF